MIERASALADLPPRAHTSAPPHILVVDDDADFLAVTAEFLASEGFVVSVARTAGEALVRAVRDPPDVILLDLLLPGADGIDVLEALREEPETRGAVVVACTALGERDAAALLPSLGFDGIIAKPVEPERLAKALRALATGR